LPQSIATGIATETIGMTWGATNYILSKHKGKAIDFKAFRAVVPFTTLGVFVGLFLFVYAPMPILRFIVGFVIASIALYQIWLAGENKLGTKKRANLVILTKNHNRIYQFFSGTFSATTGTGVAEMSQPMLEEKAGLMTLRANATAILLEACADWIITATNLKLGNLRFDILIFTVSGVLIGGVIGPRLAKYLNPRIMKIIFGISVTTIGFIYIVTSWNDLLEMLKN
tara:strand:+ start:2362 stop:3042 length:681 start_codon:yes stop_codon:yes gene_type:complete